MSKTKKNVSVTAKSVKETPLKKYKDSDNFFIKYQSLIYCAIIIFTVIIFFSEGFFGGKIFTSADNLSPFSFKTYLENAQRDGIFPLWIPHIFGGMPSLSAMLTGLPSIHNIYSYILDTSLKAFAGDNLFFFTVPYYMIFGISLFAYIRYKFKNNNIALFCALVGVLATPIIQLIIVGHHTKMMTFAFVPLIFLIIDILIDSDFKNVFKIILNLALLSVIIYLQLHYHHIQMLFYTYLMIGCYFVYIIVYKLISKEKVKSILVALSIFIVATLFAVGMDADILMSLKEYNKYSIRGQASITNLAQTTEGTAQPLDYEYATNWSFSPGEILTFIIPYYYGFGDVTIDGQRQNLYWGQMPFTDSPVYFGVVVLILALVGIIFNFRKNPSVQAYTFIIILFLFISFGRTFPIIYDLFYNYMPFFSSFRAPVMIHYFIDLVFVILAGFGIKSIIEAVKDSVLKEKLRKTTFVFWGIAGIIFIMSIIGFESSYKNSVLNGPKATDAKMQGASPQQISQYFNQVATVAYENLIADMRLHSILIALTFLLIYFYLNGKIKVSYLYLGLILIGVFDLWNISSKTLHWEAASQKEQLFAKSDYVNFILNKDPQTFQYRIAEMNRGQLATSNFLAYYDLHQFNGYHGAKIRIYQDAIDVVGGNNPNLLSLANVKYLISDSPLQDTNFIQVFKGTKLVYENKNYLPRAFFVNEYKVDTGLNILNNIKNGVFNPRETAYLEKDINKTIDKPDSTASISLESANIHNIVYNVNATGNNMIVFSEIYYPAGWKVYIDGKETEFYKTNYLFRSIIVPPGSHKVEWKFEPETYYTGKMISTSVNIIVTLMIIIGLGYPLLRNRKNQITELS